MTSELRNNKVASSPCERGDQEGTLANHARRFSRRPRVYEKSFIGCPAKPLPCPLPSRSGKPRLGRPAIQALERSGFGAGLRPIVVSLAIAFLSIGGAHAASSDALTVTVRPNAYYAVDIDTANVALDLGTVALAASTGTVRPSTVTIESTYAMTDLKIQGWIASAGTAWTFDDDTTGGEVDRVAAWAVFTSTLQAATPDQTGGFFNGTAAGQSDSDVIDATSRYIGTSSGDGTVDLFEAVGEANFKDMDALPVNAQAHLWLRFRLPSATTTNDPQAITVTLTAIAPN